MKYKDFYCYSTNLNKWFESNGFYPIYDDKHHKTKRKFWVYKGGRILDLLLTEYRQNKDNIYK